MITICSQFLCNIKVPFPVYSRSGGFSTSRLPVFRLFPVSAIFIIIIIIMAFSPRGEHGHYFLPDFPFCMHTLLAAALFAFLHVLNLISISFLSTVLRFFESSHFLLPFLCPYQRRPCYFILSHPQYTLCHNLYPLSSPYLFTY